MAHNYSQPFYGAPFAFPPPQPAPGTQGNEQNGPPHMQAAPARDVFQSIPGLHPPGLPGINFNSYGQNSQQPPFPPGKSCLRHAPLCMRGLTETCSSMAAAPASRSKHVAAVLPAERHEPPTTHSWLRISSPIASSHTTESACSQRFCSTPSAALSSAADGTPVRTSTGGYGDGQRRW